MLESLRKTQAVEKVTVFNSPDFEPHMVDGGSQSDSDIHSHSSAVTSSEQKTPTKQVTIDPQRNRDIGEFVTNRLSKDQLLRVRRNATNEFRKDFTPCETLRFFTQYPSNVRKQLLDIAQYIYIKESDRCVFEQGDVLEGYYVLIRGTIKIK